MTQTNIKRLIGNIRNTNVYTPIIEAIVNSMQAIEDKESKDGKISVYVERELELIRVVAK